MTWQFMSHHATSIVGLRLVQCVACSGVGEGEGEGED